MHGVAEKGSLMKKGGMRPGQAIILTKPIGTGTLFAADMRGKVTCFIHDEYSGRNFETCKQASGRWVSAALDSMRQPSADAARVLMKHGATACTDVTGFGLLGHLVEMCKGPRHMATCLLCSRFDHLV